MQRNTIQFAWLVIGHVVLRRSTLSVTAALSRHVDYFRADDPGIIVSTAPNRGRVDKSPQQRMESECHILEQG
jgi:hypothetical protein